MDWLRYYTNTLESSKVQSLPPVLFKAWVNLLCVARIFDGAIPDNGEVAFRLRCTEKQCAEWIGELQRRELLERNDSGKLTPHDWDEHQYSSDSSTERSRASRERKKQRRENVPRNGHATLQQRPRTEQIQNRAESEAETFQPLRIDGVAEFPKVLAEIRKHDPGADDFFVRRLMGETVQACLSNSKFPPAMLEHVTDENVARVVAESYRTGPRNHGTGLLLKRVPSIVVTWSQEEAS